MQTKYHTTARNASHYVTGLNRVMNESIRGSATRIMKTDHSLFSYFGLIAAGVLVGVGTLWAFDRGGHDFSVFFAAWRLVVGGHGSEIYHATPDRFLYAPGFAWILAPIAYLPKKLALAIWCLGKAAALGYLIREFSFRIRGSNSVLSLGICGWAVMWVARPLLIDFQYGQVNLFVLTASLWALFEHFGRLRAPSRRFLSWFVFGIAAVSKLFPLPLALVPWFVNAGISKKDLMRERLALGLGILTALFLPMVSEGFSGCIKLLLEWKGALVSKGLPLESHNQSFIAFLHHYFSGVPTQVLSHGPRPVTLGGPWFSDEVIQLLGVAWILLIAGFLLAWIMVGSTKRDPLSWIAIAIAALILPSHLVWKPYFIMGLPAAILTVSQLPKNAVSLSIVFVGINLTSFDVVGPAWSARLEAGALMLWMHLLLLGLGLVKK